MALLLTALPATAQDLRIGGTGAALGTMRLLAEAHARKKPEIRIEVLPSMGSNGAIKALMAGAIELAVSARRPDDSELKAGAQALEYGCTPFVFATQSINPARGISSRNLVDIYAGRLDQWREGQALRLVLRPQADLDSKIIKSISPELRQAAESAEQRKGMVFAVTDQDAADALEKISGSFGPSTLALILTERRALTALALDGVQPDARALADGRYPLGKCLLMIAGPKSPPAALDFMRFVQSPAGREVLETTGHWVR
jgi:phosphate transport system substrate-binding protein